MKLFFKGSKFTGCEIFCGDSLDTDNAASPYHSNTSEATVGVEE